MQDEAFGHVSVPEGVFTRRHFFRVAAGAGASAGLLPAAARARPASRTGADAVGGDLHLFTWQGYDLTGPFAQWRSQHHIHQTVKYINNQFDVAAILRGPGGKQYDSSS